MIRAMSRFDPVVESLVDRGWFVGDGLLPQDTVRGLALEARRLSDEGAFRQAGIGREQGHRIRTDIRGDSILWIDDAYESTPMNSFRIFLDELRLTLNRELYLGLRSFEMQFAHYAVGARYDRHLDRFSDASARTITCIVYLNEGWTPDDGGELRMWLENGPLDVTPLAGRCVVFRSELVEHEVRPARRERYSLTGWFRRR